MVRRRLTQEERKKETRQLLLESAVETFAQLGFHGASVDKIAENAGFSKGAFYAHFHSKEELFLAILEQQMQLHVNNVRQVIDQQQSLSHFIETMNEYFVSVRQKNRTWSMLTMEFLLYAMREESVRHKWSNMITQSVEQISKAIEKLMSKENHESTLSATEMAWTILSLENGLAIFYYISEDRVPLHLYGKALQNMLLFPR
ncbi:TetR/AcrR family transcriptional regulator [Brevibacillus sp. WF146]|uniref:TetR/AcrR family transcriptional regulator n=1 Tax=Brevibacillus sp. WF146 TaxID=319501 RepID=UPI0007EC7A0D|nr:TetR/AcrR family transcriptional regulator [Brevibacillus sp. WF146]UYZ15198.1 TetR/AcrR family transcriptional regulator [Brevibacillus sp. WF146]